MLTGRNFLNENAHHIVIINYPLFIIHSFSAHVVSGSGRGRTIGSPTINLHLQDVPATLQEGVFAAMALIEGERLRAALFYGPRPVFNDVPACELHLIDTVPLVIPDTLSVDVIGFIRSVRNFNTVPDLQRQIAIDVAEARAMLDAYDPTPPQNTDS